MIAYYLIGLAGGITGGSLAFSIINSFKKNPWIVFLDKILESRRKIDLIEGYLNGPLAERLSEIEMDIAGKKDASD